MNEVLGISASASAGIPGVARIESKVEFVRQFEATSRSLFLVVHSKRAAEFTLAGPRFAPGIQPPRNRDEAASFYFRYGDSFTSSLSEGAEYAAVYEFYTETEKQSEEVRGTLGASGVVDGVEVSAEVGTCIGHALRKTHTMWNFDQLLVGHTKLGLPAAKPEPICAFALDFARETPDSPVVISFSTTGYETLMEDRGCFQEIRSNRQALDEPESGIAALRTTRYELQNQGKWLKDVVYKAFGYEGDSELEGRLEAVKRALAAQRWWLGTVGQNPTVVVPPPQTESAGWGMPRLHYTWMSPGHWGGPEGAGFNDVPMMDPNRLMVVRKIQFRCAKCIDKVKATYARVVDAKFSSEHDVTTEHGGNGGEDSNELTLDLSQNERITEIEGWTGVDGTPVTKLRIRTNKQHMTFPWPNDTWPSKSSSTVTFKPPTAFVGFKGRVNDNYVTELTARQIKLLPATWEPA